ncbi:glycosyltransferase [Agreia sp. PsM10]|uniref:glycosyltransferase n=1 Tax=Agreia sp. PsM10 TaxID=3030533 RepID=UPI00263B97D5|nr:glycosyltransferase [Agreia sp. PsM10]MDN4641333.1 glycosyltransferase [Agreia sp. PsM10]
MTKRLVIVQPYVPKYRIPLFSSLVDELARDGIDCVVAAGEPQGIQAARNDRADAEWLVPVRRHEVRVGRASIKFSNLGRVLSRADGVIVGLEGTSVDAYRVILNGIFRGMRVGLWGHVASYIGPPNSIDLALEKWQMRRADQVFAYTSGGERAALKAGIGSEKITVLMNTVDTNALRDASTMINDRDINKFVVDHELEGRRAVAFIGGLDESKRIAFLADALDRLWKVAPDIVLLIGGEGKLAYLLDSARSRGQVRILGYVGPTEKVILSRVSKALLMPGRIGLVAVESLFLKMPIVTTDWPYHAPESEYLIEGESKFTARNEAGDFADKVLEVVALGRSPQIGEWRYPEIEDMVENFANGVKRMLL